MRMMTGAILILAGTMLLSVFELRDKTADPDPRKWFWAYSLILSGIGWFFMFWGVWRDLSAARWRRHQRHKGDT